MNGENLGLRQLAAAFCTFIRIESKAQASLRSPRSTFDVFELANLEPANRTCEPGTCELANVF
jgi:hypothetical protein